MMEDGYSDTDTQAPDYSEVTYEEQQNFKFITCADTGKFILPLTKVWKRSYWDQSGSGAYGTAWTWTSVLISPEAYTMRILKGD